MSLENGLASLSTTASSSTSSTTVELVNQENDKQQQFKLIKSKACESSNLDDNCSPAKKTRLTTENQNDSADEKSSQPTSSSESSSSTSSSSSSSSTSVSNLFKSAHRSRTPLQNNDIQNPRQLLTHLIPNLDISKIPSNLDDFDICRLVYQIMSTSSTQSESDPTTQIDLDSLELPSSSAALNHASAISSLFLTQRDKLPNVNTIEQCIDLIQNSKNILVLTGAGCSVSCGIPDFRSRDGIYARLRVDFPDLPDPQSMFDIFYFEHDPRPFFKFAKEIYPGQFKPSLSHLFIKKLEDHGKLLRNYTQNIDTLELTAQIKNVIQCHGSFATATCTVCKYKVDAEYIKERIFNQEIPYCDKCTQETNTTSPGILKPDIVFFGEGLPELYHKSINEDKSKCDLLIVIGSSLKVKPVANIPHLLPKNIPQILINRESLKHMNFDIELLGDCDVIVNEILMRLEEKSKNEQESWTNICREKILLQKIEDEEAEVYLKEENSEADNLDDSVSKVFTREFLKENSFVYFKPNVYVFHGAEISIRSMRRKLKRLRNVEELEEEEDEFETEDEFSGESTTTSESDTDDDESQEESEEEGEEEYNEEEDEDFSLEKKEEKEENFKKEES